MPAVYADSFGGLTAGQLGYANLRNQMMQEALSNFFNQNAQAKSREQQASEAEENRQLQRDLAAQSLAEQHSRDVATDKEAAERNRIANEYLLLQKKMVEQGETPQQTRQREFETNYLLRAADEGDIDSPEHAAVIAPTAPPGLRQLAYERSASIRPHLAAQYQQSKGMADVLNRRSLLNAYANDQGTGDAQKWLAENGSHTVLRFLNSNPSDEKPAPGTPYNTETATVEQVQKNVQRALAEQKRLPSINPQDKTTASLVAFDQPSGTYVPTVPRPKWYDRSLNIASPAVAPPAASPPATAPVFPPATAVPSQPNPAVAPNAVVAPQASFSPWVRNRTRYWLSQGANPQMAASRALAEEASLFGQ